MPYSCLYSMLLATVVIISAARSVVRPVDTRQYIYIVPGCTVRHSRDYPATLEENTPEKRALDRSRCGIWRASRNFIQSPVGFGDWLEISVPSASPPLSFSRITLLYAGAYTK